MTIEPLLCRRDLKIGPMEWKYLHAKFESCRVAGRSALVTIPESRLSL